MTSLRLLADDLTGALDAAAEFVALTGPVPVFWHGAIPSVLPPNAALDSGTRERGPAHATAIVHHMAPHLAGGDIAFKKIDSLLRGHVITELVACMRGESWRCCALAPAFPYQGRITQGGKQLARNTDGDWIRAGGDLIADLLSAGVAARLGRLDADLQTGITVFDAASDEDLRAVVATVRRCPHRVLWCGTGGLAQAIAGTAALSTAPLPKPILGLFGSDQSATAAQLAASDPHWMMLPDGGPASAERIKSALASTGIALASFDLPAGTSRSGAANHIAQQIGQLAQTLDPPGSLIVAGGETLRTLCQSLGATSLEVQGRIVPGVPRSLMQGGRWHGMTVISKSGAFGHPNLLRELITLEGRAS